MPIFIKKRQIERKIDRSVSIISEQLWYNKVLLNNLSYQRYKQTLVLTSTFIFLRKSMKKRYFSNVTLETTKNDSK